ncbi:MAG TPA: hypothetical protein VLS88_07975 [Polyangiales bacterium]|nr:hypothetical protein [Polyangiales bacterium]
MRGRRRALMILACWMLASAIAGSLRPRQIGAQFLSPGKLSDDHADLEGDANCGQCHSTGKRIDTDACLSCHDDLAVRIKQKTGLHGREYRGEECGRCHVEHLGRNAPLVRWPGGKKERFDHRLAGWTLKGAHASVRCEDCHDRRNRRGHSTYLGLETDCVSCHEDPHEGRFADAECTSCHNESDWSEVADVRSNHPGLSLAGGHARTKCEDCHDRGNVAPPSAGSDCVACHAQVHDAKFGDRCENCHANIRWLGLPRRIGLRAHSMTAFPLEGLHDEVACNRCHLPKLPVARRYRALRYAACGDCHRDVHRGEFGSTDCATCHDEHGFWPTLFSITQHARTDFPLEGKHQAVPCSDCHTTQRPRYDLRVRARQCVDCHQNPHGEQFAKEMAQGGCGSCHSSTGWDAPKIDHGVWPLTGAHADASCDSCHRPSEDDRKRGSGTTYRGAPRACAGCHRDTHAGQFRLTDPLRECDVCHVTDSFEIDSFDHAGLADYPLEGVHADLECVACHRKERLRGGATVVRYRLGYEECADCHANPHARRKGGR